MLHSDHDQATCDPVQEIRQRALELTGMRLSDEPRILRDTSNFISIDRGDVLELDGELYLVCGNEREGRFGIDEQPKYWVKRTVSLHTGRLHVIKLVFQESFSTCIDGQHYECFRSPQKETQVLEAVRDHPNFMHGRGVVDESGNLVRILDFIEGETLLSYLGSLEIPHEQYVERVLPNLMAQTYDCFAGIAFLHARGLCHGDIRNDHIIIEGHSGRARWIDFDFARTSLVFDVWCLGNVLNCVMAKGFVTFHALRKGQPELLDRLSEGDASVFFKHRLMNLDRIYPHLPEGLSLILRRFSVGSKDRYQKADEVVSDLGSAMDALGWTRANACSARPQHP